MLFFAGAGGLIGVAALAGRGWAISAIVVFLIMGVLCALMHVMTDM